MLADCGAGVLVHLGIDTNRLEGDGFEVLAAQGDTVEPGTPMVAWDPDAVGERADQGRNQDDGDRSDRGQPQ